MASQDPCTFPGNERAFIGRSRSAHAARSPNKATIFNPYSSRTGSLRFIQQALSKSKYALLKNKKELSETQEEKLTIVLKTFSRLAEKHALKEEFKLILDETYDCYLGVSKIADWMKQARNHYPGFIGTLKRWLAENVGYFEKRTTNGIVEGINNRLKLIKRAGYGFKNYENFKMRCLLNWHFSYPY